MNIVPINRPPSQEKFCNFVRDNEWKGLIAGSFGEIKFHDFGGYSELSPYICVRPDVTPEVLWELMTTYWDLKPPNLIISVTGGAKKFFFEKNLENIFKIGLVKASQNTGTWIITGGMNEGVMKYAGETINILRGNQQKMCGIGIGIATWGAVDNRFSLVGKPGSGKFPAIYHAKALQHGRNMATLDPNHTHFILVDDGTTRKSSGADIKVRRRLEEHILNHIVRKGEKDMETRVVLLVVEGGPKTLQNTKEAILKNIPAVIVGGSGRAADLIAYGFERKNGNKPLTMAEVGSQLMLTFGLKEESDGTYPRKAHKMLKQLNDIIQHPTLVTIFKLKNANTMDIDSALLRALVRAKTSKLESQLQLAMAFNRSDIAREEIFTAENRTKWERIDMVSVMEQALKLDKAEFVELSLDCGVKLHKFLTKRRLRDLYVNAELVQELLGIDSRDPSLVSKVICDKLLVGQITCLYSKAEDTNPDQVKDPPVPNPMQHLLLWAVMMNRRKLARLFWRMGKDHVASALTASKVLKSLAKFADSKGKLDLSLDLNNHADEFERLACGVISECYRLDKTSQDLLIRRQENWGNTTCLAIAYSSRHVKFMSLDAWQSKLNKVWMGKMAPYTTWWRVLSSMFLPFMMFLPIFTIKFEVQVKDRKQEDSVQQAGGQDRFSSVSWPWQRKAQGIGPLQAISNFHVAPITKFMYTYVFYMAYMVIFSIFILTDLHPLEENPISILEYLTIARLTSLLFEEIRQICVEHPKSRWHKVKIWFGSFWNKMDCVLHLMFLLSLVLRLTVAAGPGFEYVRGIYCITLGSSFLRMAQLFLVHAKIGPKVIMIQKMLVDLGIFLGIMLLFIFAYGVMRHALLYPNSPLGWPLLRDVFLIPYWQVYGELFIDNADGTILGSPLVTVLQALYMLLTNVLILNLLIAMFSYTFQKIQDNSEQVWRFNRNEYILEFHDRPWGPPPFIILGLAWRFGRWLWLRHKHKEDFNDFNRKFSEEYVGRLQLVERAAATNYFTKNPHLENEEIQDTTNSERPDSATTCITDAVTDLQHRMSKLEDHLGSIKDLLEQRLPKT